MSNEAVGLTCCFYLDEGEWEFMVTHNGINSSVKMIEGTPLGDLGLSFMRKFYKPLIHSVIAHKGKRNLLQEELEK